MLAKELILAVPAVTAVMVTSKSSGPSNNASSTIGTVILAVVSPAAKVTNRVTGAV